MNLSIIILNYNVRYFLELCIKSVEAAICDLDAEIIVIDNNSSDDSCKMLKEKFPRITVIENKENVGFSKANNQGVKQASGDYICILNPDTVIAEDTFTKLLDFAKTKENLGIVGCKLIDGIGEFLPESKRNIPKVKVATEKILGNCKNYYANHVDENEVAKVAILVGAFMFMKRDVFVELKGFDEDYFMYGEDIDLSYTALKKGYDNYYYGKTTVIHFKGESTLKDKNYARRFFNAMQIFYSKHFKTNKMFDLMVWFGIKMAYTFRKEQIHEVKKTSMYYFMSSKMNPKLEERLVKPVRLNSISNEFKEGSEIIFDAIELGYKTIIERLSKIDRKESITFKILPNNSNYIIGSDNSFTQGEVIIFDKN